MGDFVDEALKVVDGIPFAQRVKAHGSFWDDYIKPKPVDGIQFPSRERGLQELQWEVPAVRPPVSYETIQPSNDYGMFSCTQNNG